VCVCVCACVCVCVLRSHFGSSHFGSSALHVEAEAKSEQILVQQDRIILVEAEVKEVCLRMAGRSHDMFGWTKFGGGPKEP
jgi:hypothetical protein